MDYRHEVAQPTSRTYMSCTAEILCLSIGHFPIPPPARQQGTTILSSDSEFDEVRELCDSFQVRYFAASAFLPSLQCWPQCRLERTLVFAFISDSLGCLRQSPCLAWLLFLHFSSLSISKVLKVEFLGFLPKVLNFLTTF